MAQTVEEQKPAPKLERRAFRVPSWATCFVPFAGSRTPDLLEFENPEVFTRKLTSNRLSQSPKRRVALTATTGRYPGVRRLGWKDREEAVAVAARSFCGNLWSNGKSDPEWVWDWVFGEKLRTPENKELREQCFAEVIEFAFKLTMELGLVYGVYEPLVGGGKNDKLCSVAFVLPPGRRYSNGQLLRTLPDLRTCSMVSWLLCCSGMEMPPICMDNDIVPGARKRFKRFSKLSNASFAGANGKDSCINILLLAVEPEFQGKGYARLLLDAITDSADRLNRGVYLECSGEQNRRLFEYFGFEAAGKTMPLELPEPEIAVEEEKASEVSIINLEDEDYKREPHRYFTCSMIRKHVPRSYSL